jgi:hypothetical protein
MDKYIECPECKNHILPAKLSNLHQHFMDYHECSFDFSIFTQDLKETYGMITRLFHTREEKVGIPM